MVREKAHIGELADVEARHGATASPLESLDELQEMVLGAAVERLRLEGSLLFCDTSLHIAEWAHLLNHGQGNQ